MAIPKNGEENYMLKNFGISHGISFNRPDTAEAIIMSDRRQT
nr:MAG TPA: hypothetical protein [Bacteriophage sp.]